MHRAATNRVRSEEAALSRSPECRGKPGFRFANPGLPTLAPRCAADSRTALACAPSGAPRARLPIGASPSATR